MHMFQGCERLSPEAFVADFALELIEQERLSR